MTAEDLIRQLKLEPHPAEGGYFVETYRSLLPIPAHGSMRAASTCIFYLLTPDTCSALHRLASDEIFHFYLGDPVEMLLLHPDGRGEEIVLGQDLTAGQRLQVVVPLGVWQGARLRDGGRYALMGCTVAPGFDYRDYEHGRPATLAAQYPAWHKQIERLSRRN